MTTMYRRVYPAVGILAKYDFYYALRTCIRTNSTNSLSMVLTRDNISIIKFQEVQSLIDELLNWLKDALENNKNIGVKVRVEALSYLIVKSNEKQRSKFFDSPLHLFKANNPAYSKKCLGRLYDNMSINEINNIIPRLLEEGLFLYNNREKILLPTLYKHRLSEIVLTDEIVTKIVERIGDEDNKRSKLAIEFAYYVSLTNISDENKTKILTAIAGWRLKEQQAFTIVYDWFPYSEEYDKELPIEDIKQKIFQKFSEDDYVDAKPSSDFIHRFNRNLTDIANTCLWYKAEQIDFLLSKLSTILKDNKKFC